MRSILLAAALVAGCDGGDEPAFSPNAVGNASAEEAKALSDAETMLENKVIATDGVVTESKE